MKRDEAFDKRLGQILRVEREKAGLTIEQVASRMGMSKQAVSHYEIGIRQMWASTLRDYCKAIGISISDVFDKM